MEQEQIDEFWCRVRQKAKELHIPLNAIWEAIECNSVTAYNWSIKHRLPPLDIGVDIADILDVDVKDLLYGADRFYPNPKRILALGFSALDIMEKSLLPNKKNTDNDLETDNSGYPNHSDIIATLETATPHQIELVKTVLGIPIDKQHNKIEE